MTVGTSRGKYECYIHRYSSHEPRICLLRVHDGVASELRLGGQWLWADNLAPTMSQPDIYRVFCIVVNENNPFEVQIKKDETVSRLKDLIKEEKNDIFASIGSNLLDLYLVDFPSQKLSERMNNLQLDPSRYLEDVTMPLEEVFNGAPKTRTIHTLVVQPPTTGE